MRMLLTNCPNCAGELEKGGYCRYCNTHVRMANELDVDFSNFGKMELMINVKQGNETVLIPCIGCITNVVKSYSYMELPEIEFTFQGYISDKK